MDTITVGLLGGGQLGRMLVEAGHRLGVRVAVLDPEGSMSSAGQIAELSIEGSYHDKAKIRELSTICDVITVETEHVNTAALSELELTSSIFMHAKAETLRICSDKFLQKKFLQANHYPHTSFYSLCEPTVQELKTAGTILNYPYLLKNRNIGLNGRGHLIINHESEIEGALEELNDCELYCEALVNYSREVSILVTKYENNPHSQGQSNEGYEGGNVFSDDGCQFHTYPIVETKKDKSGKRVDLIPAPLPSHVMEDVKTMAIDIVSKLAGKGVYCVEFYVLGDDSIMVNEIIPRPHRTGSYSIDACNISQFEMHLRAILDLPCPVPTLRASCALTATIVGQSTQEQARVEAVRAMQSSLTAVHWYGNQLSFRLGRTSGHYTVIADSMAQLRLEADRLDIPNQFLQHLPAVSSGRLVLVVESAAVAHRLRSNSSTELSILDDCGVSYDLKIVSSAKSPTKVFELGQLASGNEGRGWQVIVVVSTAGDSVITHSLLTSLVPTIPVLHAELPSQDSTSSSSSSSLSSVLFLALRILAKGGERSDAELSRALELYLECQEQEHLETAAQAQWQADDELNQKRSTRYSETLKRLKY